MIDATTDTADLAAQQTCCICLEAVAARGQKPLYAPGCCGAWLHLECAYAIEVNDGSGGKCPLCRAPTELPRRPRVAAAYVPPYGVMVRQLMSIRGGPPGYDGAIVPPPLRPDRDNNSSSSDNDDDSDGNNDGNREEPPIVDLAARIEADIAVVMDQANCTRDVAIEALNANNGDLVNAILEITEEEDAVNRRVNGRAWIT